MAASEEIRSLFPQLKTTIDGYPLVYLDSAATTLKPQSVIDTLSTFLGSSYATVHRSVYRQAEIASAMYEGVRDQILAFCNGRFREEIIFTKGTTESINLVASSYGELVLEEGDEIVLSEMEHHSNIVPWQMIAQKKKASIRWIPFKIGGELDLSHAATLINPKTKILALCHVSNLFGAVNPIEELIQLAHASGAKVLIDGAQAAPSIPIDLQTLDVDFYCFSGHKLYGPTGCGVLYGKRELLEMMAPYQGGGDMISRVTLEKTTYNSLPLKFEAGTPAIAEIIALGAALSFLQTNDRKALRREKQQLLQRMEEGLTAMKGVHILNTLSPKENLISFTVDGVHPLDIATLLDLKGIAIRSGHLCAQPALRRLQLESCCRASLGIYNVASEVDFFLDSLKGAIERLR